MLRDSIKDKIKKVVQFCTLASLFVVPLVVFPSSIFPYITLKTILFYALVELAFFLYLILALFDSDYRPKKNLVLYSFLFIILCKALSALFGADPTFSFWSNSVRMSGLLTDLHLFVFFITTASLALENRFKNILIWFSVISAFLVTITVYLGTNGLNVLNKILWGPFKFFGYSGGLVGNDSYAGIYILLNFFLAIYLLFTLRNKFLKNALRVFLVAVLFSPLFFNFHIFLGQVPLNEIINNPFSLIGTSRAALIGLVFGVLSAFLLFLFDSKNLVIKRLAKFSFFASIVCLFVFLTMIFTPGTSLNNKFNSITGGYREIYIKQAILGWSDRPILGYGTGNFGYVNTKYFNPRSYDDYPHRVELNADKVHNIFLENLVEGGLLGLIAWITFIVSIFLIIGRANITWREKSVFYGLMIAYIIESITFFDVLVSSLTLVLIISILTSFNQKTTDLDINSVPKVPKNYLVYLSIILIPIGLYLSLHYFVSLPMRTINENHYYYNLDPNYRKDFLIEDLNVSYFGRGDEEAYIYAYVLSKYEQSVLEIKKLPDASVYLFDLDQMAKILESSKYNNHLVVKNNLLFRIHFMKYKIRPNTLTFKQMIYYANQQIKASPSHPIGYMNYVQSLEVAPGNKKFIEPLYERIVELNPKLTLWVDENCIEYNRVK